MDIKKRYLEIASNFLYLLVNSEVIQIEECIIDEVEKEEDIYTETGIDDCFDNDEIDSREEGFMVGYLSDN